jgi:hypothetical protein
MAESTIPSIPPSTVGAVATLARRLLFVVLLGPVAVGLGGRVQSGGGPSMASVASSALAGGPATTGLLSLTVAALAVVGALAVLPRKE